MIQDSLLRNITDYVLNDVGYNRFLEFLKSNYINSRVEDALLSSNYDDAFDKYFTQLAEKINQDYQIEKKAENIQENLNIKGFVHKNYSDDLSLSKMQEVFDQSNGKSVLQDNVLEQATQRLAETKSDLSKSKLPSKIVHLTLKELALSINNIDYFLERYCDTKTTPNFNLNKYIVSQIISVSISENWDSGEQAFHHKNGLKTSMDELIVPEDTCDYNHQQQLIEEATEKFLKLFGSETNTSGLSNELENKVITYVQDNYSSETILRRLNERFDRDSTILNIQSSIASEVSENPIFKMVSFNFWLEQFTKITDFNLLAQLYKNPSKQEAYINENMPDWKKSKDDTNVFNKVDRRVVKSQLENLLNASFDKTWNSFLDDEGLTYQESLKFMCPNVERFSQIVTNQVDLATDEFLEKNESESVDNLQENLKKYVEDNYTDQFFKQQIKFLFNENETKGRIIDSLKMNFDLAKRNVNSSSLLNTQKLISLPISKLVSLTKQDSSKILVEEYSLNS